MSDTYKPVQTNTMPRAEKILNLVWLFINLTLFRLLPRHTIVFRIMRVLMLRCFGGKIAWSASIHPAVKIEYPWRLTMKSNSSIGAHSWIYCIDHITIGESTCISDEVHLLTASHDVHSSDFHLVHSPIIIGAGVWVATRSLILPGVIIANMTVVAAGSVVTKSTNEFDIVGGNPAKFIKKRIIRS